MEIFKKYDDIYVIREGNHFTISRDESNLPETEDRIPYDTALACGVTDSTVPGCLILVKDRKMGFMTIKRFKHQYEAHYFSKSDPFLYDSIEFVTCAKWQDSVDDGVNRGCLLLQKNGNWGAVEVYQESYSYRPYKHIIPIEYTKDEVLRQILELYPETSEQSSDKISDFYENNSY